jgi:RNA polymerase sigma factor (sigma-70 family)
MMRHQHEVEWNDLLRVHHGLVERLRGSGNQTNWQPFFHEHWRTVYHAARRCGLSESEAEEVVCETVLAAGTSVETSRFNPEVCPFKSWLMQLTRWQIANRLRSRNRPEEQPVGSGAKSGGDTEFLLASSAQNLPFESVWEESWQKNLEYLALERLKQQVPHKDYQIYYLREVKEKRTREVAQLTGTSAVTVYLVHHRMANLVKKELTALRKQQS